MTVATATKGTLRDPLIDGLIPAEGFRVWSVVVTVFGDLAQSEGQTLSGAVLGALTLPLGIRPEALRVALHRLKKDGWLMAERAGRGSYYGLSVRGRSESQAAGARIYGLQTKEPTSWRLAIQDPASAAQIDAPGFQIQPGVRLLIGHENPPQDFVLEGQIKTMPHWLKAQLGPPEIAEAFARLDRQLAEVLGKKTKFQQLGPMDIAVLRILIVHEWRRILLRMPAVPDALLPAPWPGISCRHRVHELLAHLPRPTQSDLQATVR